MEYNNNVLSELTKNYITSFSEIVSKPLKTIFEEAGYDIPLDVIQSSLLKLMDTNTAYSSDSSPKKSEKNSKENKIPKTRKKNKEKEGGNTKPQCIGVYVRGPKTGKRCEKFASKDSEFCVSCKNTKNTKKKCQTSFSNTTLGEASNFLTKKTDSDNEEIEENKQTSIKATEWDAERGLLLDETYGFILTVSASDDVFAVGMLNKDTGEIEPLTEKEKNKAKELNLLLVEDIKKQDVEIESMFDDNKIPNIPDL